MKYTGAFSSGKEYEVGDIAVYTDGVPYWLQKPAPVGTECYDTMYWGRLGQPYASVVMMLHPILSGLAETKAAVDGVVFDSKTLTLDSSTESSTKRYAITVDDEDGLVATEIEEEAGD